MVLAYFLETGYAQLVQKQSQMMGAENRHQIQQIEKKWNFSTRVEILIEKIFNKTCKPHPLAAIIAFLRAYSP